MKSAQTPQYDHNLLIYLKMNKTVKILLPQIRNIAYAVSNNELSDRDTAVHPHQLVPLNKGTEFEISVIPSI
ncbi:hypothetical protein [Photorhabdus luminescens]|uniref:hypothetical protein n=1 Tax=Photorhabdus luminescens TaxID=29488 RepID=UPI00224095F4|nr:hypothetical protein [Photorhabdus luminescens]MCW7762308.1 hypothetical protein [Photorhabdus luminescens subsp. venezuelensis]